MTRLLSIVFVAALYAAAAISGFAQEPEAKLNPIKWSFNAQLPKTPLKAGEQFTVTLIAEIESGWHLYSTTPIENGPKPTRIALVTGQGFAAAGEIEAPDPLIENDPNFGVEVEFYEEKVSFVLPVKVLAESKAGTTILTVQVRYQTCNQRLCLPPKLLKFETPVEIAARE